jgi:phosphoribosyl 1,2-cyclic phosphodiesterase
VSCDPRYDILSTGSQGNAVLIEDSVLIDCGVPWRALAGCWRRLALVLLTHIHADHFNPATLRRLATERPALRFACGDFLRDPLAACGVEPTRIDTLTPGWRYDYGAFRVAPVALRHDVPNFGYKLHVSGGGRIFYATDTGGLDGVWARDYDLYLIEANHTEAGILEKIAEKKAAGVYAYERRARDMHLSKEQADDFFYQNGKQTSTLVYIHCHADAEE